MLYYEENSIKCGTREKLFNLPKKPSFLETSFKNINIL